VPCRPFFTAVERVDEALLEPSRRHVEDIGALLPAFRSRRVRAFLSGLKKELAP